MEASKKDLVIVFSHVELLEWSQRLCSLFFCAIMESTNQILRYLKSCSRKGVFYSSHGHHKVEAYNNADWEGSITDRQSTLGYCTFVGENMSKKHAMVARSSSEAEFRSMAHGVCELVWLKRLLMEFGVFVPHHMALYYDNKAAIEVDHFIKEKLQWG